jgi:GxxExxY protein
MEINELTERVIGACIEIHKTLGPGLLESAYEECLCHELRLARMEFERQRPLPVGYKGVKLDCGYRLDVIVENKLIVELKSVERLAPIHDAQLLTYLKLSGMTVGLIINFNVPVLRRGIKRIVNHFDETSELTRNESEIEIDERKPIRFGKL